MGLGRTDTSLDSSHCTNMKTLITTLLFAVVLTVNAQLKPNYLTTNTTPFNLDAGVSMYVPTLYTTNLLTTNMSVTDFLFIGTAQVNYLSMLGNLNQQGATGTNYFMANTNSFAGSISAQKYYGVGDGQFNLQTNGNGTITPDHILWFTNVNGDVFKVAAQKL